MLMTKISSILWGLRQRVIRLVNISYLINSNKTYSSVALNNLFHIINFESVIFSFIFYNLSFVENT